ncbi:MAG: GNAT family N-acetyltransferase [Pirellulales bacterium]
MAESPIWKIERLDKRHDRKSFNCGDALLNDYLKKFAGQNERVSVSRHYVAVPADSNSILGYYSLSAGSVHWGYLPDEQRMRLPKYPVPVAHLGRLAVDKSTQGQGLGEFLLLDALARVARLTNEIGIQAVEVVAASENARQFYEKYGFLSLLDDQLHLYAAVGTLRNLGFA